MTRPTFGTIADLDAWIARAADAGDPDPTIESIPARDRLAADAAVLATLRRTTHPQPSKRPS